MSPQVSIILTVAEFCWGLSHHMWSKCSTKGFSLPSECQCFGIAVASADEHGWKAFGCSLKPVFLVKWLTFEPPFRDHMAIIDGRLTVCSSSTSASITFDYNADSGIPGPSCVVCGDPIRVGKAAAAIDMSSHGALCKLAADPRHGDALCCHIMHAWCAEYLTDSLCPGCTDPASPTADTAQIPLPPIRRIGFDVGGVIVRHREDMDLDSGVDRAGLLGDDYLHAQATAGALDTLADVVKKLGRENVHIISKCGAETEARTLEWMEYSGFFEKTGIQRQHVHFCRDVKDKAPLVAKLKLDAFVDDRIDVLRPMLSLVGVRPLLFMPKQETLGQSPAFWIPRIEKLAGWESVRALCLGLGT